MRAVRQPHALACWSGCFLAARFCCAAHCLLQEGRASLTLRGPFLLNWLGPFAGPLIIPKGDPQVWSLRCRPKLHVFTDGAFEDGLASIDGGLCSALAVRFLRRSRLAGLKLAVSIPSFRQSFWRLLAQRNCGLLHCGAPTVASGLTMRWCDLAPLMPSFAEGLPCAFWSIFFATRLLRTLCCVGVSFAVPQQPC